MNIVILAGGVGTRLWPLGRRNSPKQFFPVIGQEPLVRETYRRFLKTYGASRIFFSVTADLLIPLRKLFPRLPAAQFIMEPERRDTAPAMGYVAAVLSLTIPDEPLVFVPADHFVADQQKYLACFKAGEKLVKETGKLVDIGITATFPSTVLGYTKVGALYKKLNGVAVYRFAGHTEKPAARTALRYLASGQYLWHGNYYMWTPRRFLAALVHYAPSLGKGLLKIRALIQAGRAAAVRREYARLERTSFDYAVTEKIKRREVLIIRGDFGWSDVGAWDLLHEQLRHTGDGAGNVVRGQVAHWDTRNCLIYAHPKRLVAAVGLADTVVIDTNDAVLVCPKDRAQDVKKLFPLLEQKKLAKYL
ncbi:MAG: mannose-1-phosphate guanylyltransferase [Candidatus Magasanikbacteria bacterium]|nr:mannose-1-phosphate guanylyltransferase [Candidatus Magasanikbacteria bacterium]